MLITIVSHCSINKIELWLSMWLVKYVNLDFKSIQGNKAESPLFYFHRKKVAQVGLGPRLLALKAVALPTEPLYAKDKLKLYMIGQLLEQRCQKPFIGQYIGLKEYSAGY